MGYRSLQDCVNDLEQQGQLVKIEQEVDADLEMAAIHRRVNEQGGPALFYQNIKGTSFKAVSNIYGTKDRINYIFRKELPIMARLSALRNDPSAAFKKWWSNLGLVSKAIHGLAKEMSSGEILKFETNISSLPLVKSWPKDGGAFVTLPQVISQDPDKPGIKHSNIGMYRIQLNGNDYLTDQEVGLHYQIHRGIGVHHQKYKGLNQPFKVAVSIGGPPAHTIASILPLPEGMSESIFAGLLNGRRFRYINRKGYLINADADFCITGIVDPIALKMEGPFGDHLGYYSLAHPFPFMKVDRVFHKPNAIWHFTVVGRPPAEDSGFGYLIHELFGDIIPSEFPGIQQVHAVDAAGVHPLLFAIGSERYMPFRSPRPEEILTQANRLLGSGQTSLAKYLFITAPFDQRRPDIYNIKAFLVWVLSRMDFTRDIHFQTNTTIDTLDYSGSGLNQGSKVVMAAYGPEVRTGTIDLPANLYLPPGFSQPKIFAPGIVVVKGSPHHNPLVGRAQAGTFCDSIMVNQWKGVHLVVIVDDVNFTTANDQNFVWVTFTRSNPADDIFGVNRRVIHKHWTIDAPMVIDARVKQHHAPGLIDDPDILKRIDRFFVKNGPLAQWG